MTLSAVELMWWSGAWARLRWAREPTDGRVWATANYGAGGQ